MRRLLAVLPIALLALQSGSVTTTRNLQHMTEMTRNPGGERMAILSQGLPVTIVEPGERWTRVRVEGWVATTDIEDAGVEPPAAPAVTAPPVVPATPPAGPATSSLTGSIFVVHEGKTLVGRDTAVRLIREPAAAQKRIADLRAACDTRRNELVGEAARLKKAMDSAMKQEDTSAAFAKFDEAKWARQEVLKNLGNLDADCAVRLDESLAKAEAARVLTNDTGGFTFAEIAAGDYLLVARIEAEKTRFVWEVPIALQPGERMAKDLTNGNLGHTTPVPTYK